MVPVIPKQIKDFFTLFKFSFTPFYHLLFTCVNKSERFAWLIDRIADILKAISSQQSVATGSKIQGVSGIKTIATCSLNA
jgi:hypothetical protein